MARNEEKHAGRLNRLWLQQLDEERLKKNPLRPGLGSLRTADEVKKWIPSIKNDIDFYLKQSQVGCYPERKISEFTSMIESLTKEYKAYLRKYRELEGNREEVPWSDKPYTRKHKLPPVSETSNNTKESDNEEDTIPLKKFTPLSVPILENEESYKDLYDYEIMNNAAVSLNSTETIDVTTEHILLPNNEFDDKPLELNRIKIDNYRFLKGKRESEAPSVSLNESCGRSCCSCEQTLSLVTASCECCGNSRKELSHNMQTDIMNEHCEVNDKNHVGNLSYHNILNLPYSDSSGDEEEG